MSPKLIVLGVVATVVSVAPIIASAQQHPANPNVPVTSRPRPDFDPLGIRVGSFSLFPVLELAGEYNDNIFASQDEDDDFIGFVRPSVTLSSNFAQNSLDFSAGGEIARYEEFDDENYEDAFVRALGRLDIRRDLSAAGLLEYRLLHENRDDPEDTGASEVTRFDRFRVRGTLDKTFNRVGTALTGMYQRYDYEDAGELTNDDRDRDQFDVALRVGYDISPRFDAFVEGQGQFQIHDSEIDDTGVNRDFQKFSVVAGADIDITSVLFGEIFGGITSADFDDPAFSDETGFTAGGGLTWNVTELTTIIGTVERSIEPTTQSDASSNFQTQLTLDVDHELLRNVLVGAGFQYDRDEFEGLDEDEDTFEVGARVQYLLNRNIAVEGSYAYQTRIADDDTEEFRRNVVRIGLVGRL
ncbi:MAG: outer membrane beta-barrel protein [Geminicoccaceae bacterium]